MTTLDRRALLAGAAVLPMAAQAAASLPTGAPKGPDDERWWRTVAAQYNVNPDIIQLENGNWGIMARPVMAAYERNIERVNRDNSYYARRGFGADLDSIRAQVATGLGAAPDEIAFARNATEALRTLIQNYNRLRPGDAVLYADLDYDAMQGFMEGLHRSRGVEVIKIALPEPATRQALIDSYARAFDANPRIRMVLLTHLSHRTGLALPLAEIVALAKSRGIDAIVDAAHSWGQLEAGTIAAGVDFAGFNLHKWMGAPLGVGAFYIRKSRLDAIDPDPGNGLPVGATAESRIHTGTVDMAAQLTVPAALAFQNAVGAPNRIARLRWLRDRWAEELRGLNGLEILTPADPTLHAGTTAFRIRGRTSVADNIAIARTLLDEFGIFSVHRTGVARGACIRICPALFTSPAQIDALVRALRIVVPRMAV
ncbi:aminotransferase class V-fold PLP-dependent enzyme [Sphingomonas sp. SUN039]|uniref:aminotransferase class V-fold PLP-dependent enzyme n=1 Tax=Sphingomonas sp. SUN039 TaxID=2937787 RepID=UPI00216485C9|nr:aminotransferase class V-fold PLP-dependent enzyme [Sphingomonas sp. SUN039]UVO54314.1 aminotransferase class V-fold PLP-dependent enzyme [Sphingomonas sp. SUN039]